MAPVPNAELIMNLRLSILLPSLKKYSSYSLLLFGEGVRRRDEAERDFLACKIIDLVFSIAIRFVG